MLFFNSSTWPKAFMTTTFLFMTTLGELMPFRPEEIVRQQHDRGLAQSCSEDKRGLKTNPNVGVVEPSGVCVSSGGRQIYLLTTCSSACHYLRRRGPGFGGPRGTPIDASAVVGPPLFCVGGSRALSRCTTHGQKQIFALHPLHGKYDLLHDSSFCTYPSISQKRDDSGRGF